MNTQLQKIEEPVDSLDFWNKRYYQEEPKKLSLLSRIILLIVNLLCKILNHRSKSTFTIQTVTEIQPSIENKMTAEILPPPNSGKVYYTADDLDDVLKGCYEKSYKTALEIIEEFARKNKLCISIIKRNNNAVYTIIDINGHTLPCTIYLYSTSTETRRVAKSSLTEAITNLKKDIEEN